MHVGDCTIAQANLKRVTWLVILLSCAQHQRSGWQGVRLPASTLTFFFSKGFRSACAGLVRCWLCFLQSLGRDSPKGRAEYGFLSTDAKWLDFPCSGFLQQGNALPVVKWELHGSPHKSSALWTLPLPVHVWLTTRRASLHTYTLAEAQGLSGCSYLRRIRR